MPEMDGYACAAEIRRLEANRRHVPIIAMTAHVRKEDRDKCLMAGMDDFLSKPVHLTQLEETLMRWLCDPVTPAAAVPGASVPPRPAWVAAAGHSDSSRPEPPVDMDVLQELAPSDRQRLRQLARQYIEQTTGQLATLRGLVAAGAAAEIQRLAHGAAGSSAMCGMTHLVELLRDMEQLGHHGRLARAPGLFAEIEAEFERIKSFLTEVLL